MKNHMKTGAMVTATAPSGGVVSGDLVILGSFFGIAATSADEDQEFELKVGEVWELAKPNDEAWALGQSVYWDAGAKKATVDPSGNTLIGAANSAATETAVVGNVRLNDAFGMPAGAAGVSITPAAGGANVSEVAIQVTDGAGNPVSGVHILDVWLSDAASGAGLTGTTASGTVQAKSASGYVVEAVTAKKYLRVQTLATGIFTLEITDTSKTAFKVCAYVGGKTTVHTLETADYGA